MQTDPTAPPVQPRAPAPERSDAPLPAGTNTPRCRHPAPACVRWRANSCPPPSRCPARSRAPPRSTRSTHKARSAPLPARALRRITGSRKPPATAREPPPTNTAPSPAASAARHRRPTPESPPRLNHNRQPETKNRLLPPPQYPAIAACGAKPLLFFAVFADLCVFARNIAPLDLTRLSVTHLALPRRR